MKKLLFLILIGLFLFSCKPDKSCSREDEITYENIPDSNISQIPYKGDELLSFVNQTGDTAVFKCTGYNNYYEQSYYWNGNADCSWKSITKTQQIDFTFIDTANENRNFRVRYEGEINPVEFASNTYIYFYSPYNLKNVARGINYFYNPIHSDSLVLINGKILYGSFMDKDLGIFYSINYGIISFTDQFQNRWTLFNE